MIEIFIAVFLFRNIAKLSQARGLSPLWTALGLVAFFGGELLGFSAGQALGLGLSSYWMGLGLGGSAAVFAWHYINSLAPAGVAAPVAA